MILFCMGKWNKRLYFDTESPMPMLVFSFGQFSAMNMRSVVIYIIDTKKN